MSAFPNHLHALLDPGAYPHPVQAVELVETHVSWILLTGEFAYKIKRPVRYSFVDLQSPERRAFLCHEEIRLNLRFAPELYLGVCPIYCVEGKPRLEGSGRILEYAVRMRQFPRTDQLDQLLEAGLVETVELESFGRELARIHARLPIPQPAQSWGRPAAMRVLVLDNAAECTHLGKFFGAVATDAQALQAGLEARLDSATQLLSERFAAGRVRECHADLHAGNIVRRGAHLLAFDCLEFDPALRWIDVADEISFLLADLDSRQKALHSHAFLAGYLAESGDYQACTLLPLFKAHRALVRAKITALKATAANPAEENRLGRPFESYVDCARRSLTPQRAVLILMCGLSGSGKTWIAQRLTPKVLGIHLRSDVERRRMAGLSASDRSDSPIAEGLYSPRITEEVYGHLASYARDTLASGYSTIVDATFGRRSERGRFHSLSVQLGARVCIVHCSAPQQVLRDRIIKRLDRNDDPSEADLSVLGWQETHFEPIQADEAFTVFEVTTIEPAVDKLFEQIAALRA